LRQLSCYDNRVSVGWSVKRILGSCFAARICPGNFGIESEGGFRDNHRG
jgi:hypothetical protein